MQGRGLKLYIYHCLQPVPGVAPYAGAWIETFNSQLLLRFS